MMTESSGSSHKQFARKLSGMSVDDLARMVFVVNVIHREFKGEWSGIPNVTLKEFIGAVQDEAGMRVVK